MSWRRTATVCGLTLAGVTMTLGGCECTEGAAKVADKATGTSDVEQMKKMEKQIGDIQKQHNQQLDETLKKNE